MSAFLNSLFSAVIAAVVVWWLLSRERRGGRTGNAENAEIDRLRSVVEELTAALENRADAAGQRLSKVIAEGQAVQSLLDRTLTSVGAQILRPESSVSNLPRAQEGVIAPQVVAVPAGEVDAISSRPEPTAVATVAVAALPEGAISSPAGAREEDLVPRQESEPPSPRRSDLLNISALSDTEFPPVSTSSVASFPQGGTDPRQDSASREGVSARLEKSNDEVAPRATETQRKPDDEITDRELKVRRLVSAGVTNSIEIARQTGMTRGEVELMLTLHNLHIAPLSNVPAGAPVYGAELTEKSSAAHPATSDHVIAIQAGESGRDDTSSAAQPATADNASAVVAAPAGSIQMSQDDRYAAIYALVASGVTDSVEIARRTGLGRGEVELHMGLHARHVL